MFFIDFWMPRGAQMAPFGVPLGSNLVQIRAPVPVWVPSPPQGSPKGHFWVLLGAMFVIFGMDFEHIWGYILWGISRVFWRCPGEYWMDSVCIARVFRQYLLGISLRYYWGILVFFWRCPGECWMEVVGVRYSLDVLQAFLRCSLAVLWYFFSIP